MLVKTLGEVLNGEHQVCGGSLFGVLRQYQQRAPSSILLVQTHSLCWVVKGALGVVEFRIMTLDLME